VHLLFGIVFKLFRLIDHTKNRSEKREREDDVKSNASEDDDECVGPSLSELTDTVEKKKRKGKFLF